MIIGEASYLALHQQGELTKRAEGLRQLLSPCRLCPRRCGSLRLEGQVGLCRASEQVEVSAVTPHFGEEPVLTGSGGVGNIFFTHCNLKCVYCQNYQISQTPGEETGKGVVTGKAPGVGERTKATGEMSRAGREKLPEVTGPGQDHHDGKTSVLRAGIGVSCQYQDSVFSLAQGMLDLQLKGVSAIGLVSPTHYVPQIIDALILAVEGGLHLPLIYNTNAYDSLEVLRLLEGIVDIYLPDLKYADNQVANHLSAASGYREISRQAIREMYRQLGSYLWLDETGILERGLILRHLVLPGDLAGSRDSLRWVAEELSPRVTLSIMSQYYPAYRAAQFPPLQRTVTPQEYRQVVRLAQDLGFRNIFTQEMSSPESYRPDFAKRERPFREDW